MSERRSSKEPTAYLSMSTVIARRLTELQWGKSSAVDGEVGAAHRPFYVGHDTESRRNPRAGLER